MDSLEWIYVLEFYNNLLGLGTEEEPSCRLLGPTRDNLKIKKSLDLHEKSLDLSNYEIFPHKILKSRTFKKSSTLIVNKFQHWAP